MMHHYPLANCNWRYITWLRRMSRRYNTPMDPLGRRPMAKALTNYTNGQPTLYIFHVATSFAVHINVTSRIAAPPFHSSIIHSHFNIKQKYIYIYLNIYLTYTFINVQIDKYYITIYYNYIYISNFTLFRMFFAFFM